MTVEKVVDCSVSAAWFLPDEKSDAADEFLQGVMDGKVLLVEPALWPYETLNLLKMAVRRKWLTEQMAHNALHLLAQIPMTFIDAVTQGLPSVLNASLQHNLSSYDASYLNLAQSRGIELITNDEDLLALRPVLPWIKEMKKT